MRTTRPRMKKRTTRSRRNPGDILVVGSKVRDFVRSKNMRMSAEVIEALSEKIKYKLDKAIDRAKANKRQTIRAEDI